MAAISALSATVLPRRLLRGVLVVWVSLIGIWVLLSTWVLVHGQTCDPHTCLPRYALGATPGMEPLAFGAELILVVACGGLLGSAVAERVPMRWRWGYFLAQGVLVVAIGSR